ncbi:tetratricopeptide (TPR) repeat protein [Paraburkholderia sp. GAS333]|uniref:glycosyltransferase family 9 protein n=1 Tax=Paraburkholderia sp. GAS333 TaxID=3156279 RepID=UPI003D1B72D0
MQLHSPTMPSQPPPPPEAIAIWFTEAEEARHAGHFDVARARLDQVLAHDPAHARAMHAQAQVALASNELEPAQQWVTRAIATHAEAAFYGTLCVIQIRQGAYADALQTAQRGLALAPESTALLYYQALMLQVHGSPDEAARVYFTLLELEPDHPRALANLGVVLKDLGSLSEAERYLRQVIDIEPSNRGARANLGLVLLAAGHYEEAWPYFEDRAANFVDAEGRPIASNARLPLPEWRGERIDGANEDDAAASSGKRLLIVPEQGFGDSLQFVRYLPLLLERFSQVGYICRQPLRRLYEQSLSARWPGLVMLDDAYPDVSDWDYQCPLMSLPMAFSTRVETIPASVYLHADAEHSAAWRARLDALPEAGLPRVGIVWAGGHSGLTDDMARNLTFARIAPLLATHGVRWISLQKTDDDTRRADAGTSSTRLIDWMDEVTDFADTAALIDNLDLVIAVDTSVAHLAAAMGKPVWLLNRFAGCWRWLRQRDDSPWYPGVRIFTQPQRGDWNDVLSRVAIALQQRYLLGDGSGAPMTKH